MKEVIEEKRKQTTTFLAEYGKLLCVTMIILTGTSLVVALIHHSSPKVMQVSFLDIGQGDAILLQTPSGHTMLVDGGPSTVILEKLSSVLPIVERHIDVIVETHPDADHVTGLIPVLAKYDVSHVVESPLRGHTGVFDELEKMIAEEHASVHIAKRSDQIDFGDGVVAHFLYPSAHYTGNGKDTNDASVSMVVTYGDESILLTGDLPSTHERELLQDVLPHHVTIYKAGHHGSKYSSGDVLLSYIKPEYAVVSAGKDNRYGHPNPEAVGRLKVYSQEILSTIDRGTITFALDGSSVKVETSK